MRVTRSHTLHFASPVEQVFPLFTPIKEKLWTHDWDPTLVYSESETAEEKGAVFTSQHDDGRSSIWTISQYDVAEHRVEYVMVLPGSHVSQIAICCAYSAGQTDVDVTYMVTGLGAAGDAYVQAFSEADFSHHRMAWWQQAIDHYLQTGETLVGERGT